MASSNTFITPTIIAKEAVSLLENKLVLANLVDRRYKKEWEKNPPAIGASVEIKRRTDFTVRLGATYSSQNITQSYETLTINLQRGVDFDYSSLEATLSLDEFSDQIIQPAVIQLANKVERDIAGLYIDMYNAVGTPGTLPDSYGEFSPCAQRLDEMGVEEEDRYLVVTPEIYHTGLATAAVGLYQNELVKKTFQTGYVGDVAGMSSFISNNLSTHTVGAKAGTTPLTNGSGQTGASIVTDGWTASTADCVKAGDIITIAGVYAVNPITKDTLPWLKQFVVTADADSDSSGNMTISVSPALVATGAFKNASASIADGAAVTVLGTASTAYSQSFAFQKQAIALAFVPMVLPPGTEAARETYKGISIRVVRDYDIANDLILCRLDVLYGVKLVEPRRAVRLFSSH